MAMAKHMACAARTDIRLALAASRPAADQDLLSGSAASPASTSNDVRLGLRQDILPRLEVAHQCLQVAVAQKSSRKKLFHACAQAACGFGQKVARFAHCALNLVSRAAACNAPLGVSSCLMYANTSPCVALARQLLFDLLQVSRPVVALAQPVAAERGGDDVRCLRVRRSRPRRARLDAAAAGRRSRLQTTKHGGIQRRRAAWPCSPARLL